ncbi:DNA repair protein RecO [Blastochloris viridis]|uniref:DNA repair protein RecO n=1 Tax=Blastochloris viridis TaxID=1079 RepID=A0A0H5BNR6_BLAVI|nr:DNA repair protein RecO [Blastochloris viridis]ALK08608.1 DNA repair protein RecO [Blastochloris viridis]BAR98103.1 DNA recombination and repair protein RecO [Blastochloris viridis]CUU41271.1 DNA repair protein RecO [Blastochloris viridis]
MDWTDVGLVIGARTHGETSVILELMTLAHGRHLGMVRGGRSRRFAAVLQPGNTVQATWRARLDEHLGTYTVEPQVQRAATLIATPAATFGLQHVAALLRLLPERDPHPDLHAAAERVVGQLTEPMLAAALLVRFELGVLADLGFGLDLDACAMTGVRTDLSYVSPKTGRAASRTAGAPWADKLLVLPAFLTGTAEMPTAADIAAGFALTGYFFARRVYEPRGLAVPHEREAFLRALALV